MSRILPNTFTLEQIDLPSNEIEEQSKNPKFFTPYLG